MALTDPFLNQMFGNRSEFEQCHFRGSDENCCCDFVFSVQDLFKAVPVGLLCGICRGFGIVTMWKHKKREYRNPEQEDNTSNLCQPTFFAWIANNIQTFVNDKAMIFGILCTVIIPIVFGFFASFTVEGIDKRLVTSSNTVFCFLSTLIIAIWFHPEKINRDQVTLVSLRINVLVCFGGILLTLGHMPYEETFSFQEFIDLIQTRDMLAYYSTNIFASAGLWWGIYFVRQNINEDREGKTEKIEIFFQAMFLMCANTLTNFASDFSNHVLKHLFEGGNIELEILITGVSFAAIIFIVFMIFKRKMFFKDPIFMAAMICDLDVLNRVIVVLIVYRNNFSCSITDVPQFWCGILATVIGLTSLIFNQGKIVKDFDPVENEQISASN